MIPLPKKPKVISSKDNVGVFEIEALYPGYGVTIGNSLRRVLLSSLEGAAITQVKIKGAEHEFSTLPGVLEDTIIIILNLKKLRFRSFTEDPQTITLSQKGEKEVKGKDFKLTPQVELANPEAPLATLTKSSVTLNIEATVEKGIGYQPVEMRETKKKEIGVIPIDAVFTPVEKVSFSVENMRVGKRTDFDRLRIEIKTDGTLSPQESLTQASDILDRHFSLISESLPEKKEEKPKPEKKQKDPKKIKVEDLDISGRTKNALRDNNIKTVGGILRKSEETLLGLEGLGKKGVEEIKEVIKKFNLELK